MPEALSSRLGASVVPEILWNFSHFENNERLELAQIPHFYDKLPSYSGERGNFKGMPAENYEGTIYVLTNKSGRVFLNIRRELRAFDRVLVGRFALIFRGLYLVYIPFLN